MEISLCYDADAGKLTLGVIQAGLVPPTVRRQQQMNGNEGGLYFLLMFGVRHYTRYSNYVGTYLKRRSFLFSLAVHQSDAL